MQKTIKFTKNERHRKEILLILKMNIIRYV